MGLSPPGGWYPDPGDRQVLRYWDGHAWTSQVGRAPAPGWYPDPADGRALRYWGGTAWTTNVTPPPTSTPTAAATATATITEPPPVAPSNGANARVAAARLAATPLPPGPTALDEPSWPDPGRAGRDLTPARVEPKRRRGAVIVALVAAVLLAAGATGYVLMKYGTGPSGVLGSSNAPSVEAPPGYHLQTLRSARVTFAVRDTWLALDPSSPALKQAEQRVAAANPQLASTLTDFGSAASSIKFLAVDVGNRIYGSNVEILSLGLAKSALSDPLGAQGAFRKQIPNAVVSPATVAGTRGLTVTGTVDLALPAGGHVTVHATGYVVGTSTGVFSIMFGTTDDGSQDTDVQTAVRTLRLTS